MQGRARLPRGVIEEEGQEIATAASEPTPLVDALRRPGCYPHPVGEVVLVETHISWVLLAGDYAYKLKKPVDFGFLDFSTIGRRRRYCEEEVRLNRRTAPGIYLDVVPITGAPDAPVVGGEGAAIDYAVRMRRFARDDEFDALADRGALRPEHIDALAANVARFHENAAVASMEDPWGSAAAVLAPCVENFDQLAALATGDAGIAPESDQFGARLTRLRQWTLQTHADVARLIERRRAEGRVRECHGDLHMANIVLIDGDPVPFDAIEFNPALRWTDVIADIAFVVMDLEHRGLHALAQRFLDAYLTHSADYAGLALLPFHLVYRAMVRAKVAALRARQEADGAAGAPSPAINRDIDEHLILAERFARPLPVRMLLAHGVSGSGKSHLAGRLLEAGDWIRLRSDVERKRIAGVATRERGDFEPDGGLYAPETTERTYARLADLAQTVIESGYPVIVDATFLRAAQRRRFIELAHRLKVGWAILSASAAPDILRSRVLRRANEGRDPSDATVEVLERQLASAEALDDHERAHSIDVDTSAPIDLDSIEAAIRTATS